MPLTTHKYTMNIWSVTSIGIGSMVGAGIFALLGQTILLVGKDVFISFIIAGSISLLSGYSYAKLASTYPSPYGILAYYDKGFSSKILSGGFSLLYLFTLAVSISMVAKTFGIYLSGMLPSNFLWIKEEYLSNIFATILIISIFILNTRVSKDVGKAEAIIVGIKIIILGILIFAGFFHIRIKNILIEPSSSTMNILGSVGLTFFAFAGFGMMTNTAGDVKNPKETIPKAIFLAIIFVMLLYTALSLIVIGSIPQEELKKNINIAIAIAARPLLGNLGFFIISIVALLATASGINAMMFSGMKIAQGMAVQKQLPSIFLKKLFGTGSIGILYSIIGIIILTNIFDLQSVASIASMTFLLCYLAVFVANWNLKKETQSSGIIIFTGIITMSIILLSFIFTMLQTSPIILLLLILFLILCFFLEYFLITFMR